jgi:hypothetical protein
MPRTSHTRKLDPRATIAWLSATRVAAHRSQLGLLQTVVANRGGLSATLLCFGWNRPPNGLDQARRLKELEAENARLKRAVADLTVDKLILKEVAEGKY